MLFSTSYFFRESSLLSGIRTPLQLLDWFKGADTRTVSAVCLRRTFRSSCGRTHPSYTYCLPHDTTKTNRVKTRGRSTYSTLLLKSYRPLWPLASVQIAGAHWLADAVHSFGYYMLYYFGTDRLKPMRWAVSAVPLCWYDPFETMCRRSSSIIRQKRFVHQRLQNH